MQITKPIINIKPIVITIPKFVINKKVTPLPTPTPTPPPMPDPTPLPTPQPDPIPVPDPPLMRLPFGESAKQTLKIKDPPGANVYKASVSASTTTKQVTDPTAFALNQALFDGVTASHFQGAEALGQRLSEIAAKEAYKNVKSTVAISEQEDIKIDNIKISIRAKFKFTFNSKGKTPIKYSGSLVILLNGKKVNAADLPDNIKALLPDGVLA